MSVHRVQGEAGKALEKALSNLDKKVGKVGWFANARYDDKKSTPVASVAAQNEKGNPNKNIPARPFIAPTIRAKQNEWAEIATSGARSVLLGKKTIVQVLEAIGLKAAGDIRKTISLITTPPLSPRTIQARLARRSNKKKIGLLTKPLIDTKHMYNTLTNTVGDE